LDRLLAAVYDSFQKKEPRKFNDQCRRDFVFNMTDWSKDLERLAELYKNPEKFTKADANQVVSGFLDHVIPHLRAAGRLLLDYSPDDIFLELESAVRP
jgi:hypothetical protein